MIEKGPLIYRIFLIIFWVGTCLGFVSEDLFPPLNSMRSYIFIILDLLIVIAGVLAVKKKWQKWSIIFFFCLAFLSTIIINKYTNVVFINGCRDFFGLLFILPIVYYLHNNDEQYHFVSKFDKHLKAFLFVQCFCTVVQFAKHGAGDFVGGSFGNGYSGVLSMVIYMTSFYLMNKNFDRAHYFASLKKNWVLIFLLYPTFLNETKASFIYLFAYLVLLNKVEFKTVLKLLAFSPVIFGVFFGLFYLYSVITEQDFDELTGEEFYQDYLVGEDPDELIEICQMYYEGAFDNEDENVWATDLPRFTKILLLGNVLEDSKGGLLLGEGVGQMKGNTVLSKTRFAEKYEWYLVGSRTFVMTCVIQLGIIGFCWFLFVLCKSLSFKNNRSITSFNVKLYLLMFALFMLIYNDAFQNAFFCIFYFYIAASTVNMTNKPLLEESSELAQSNV